MRRRAVTAALLLLAITGLLLAWAWWLQPRLLFMPTRQLAATPADWGMAYQEVTLHSADGVALNGWYLPSPGARRVLLVFHGNAGNISHRGATLAIFRRLGLNVLIFDYRGYGRSNGWPDESGLYRDATAAWRYVTEQRGFAPGQVLLFGRSLGGAVASWLAAQQSAAGTPPGGLILESTFSSLPDMARHAFPLLSRLVPLRYRFDSAARLAAVRCPVLVLHSPDDDIIPYALGRRLYAAAPAPKAFRPLRGGHNDGFLRSQPGYQQVLAAFLAGRLPAAETPR